MRKYWILGKEYDLDSGDDVKELCDRIGERQEARAANDLALIASTLLSAALEVNHA